MNRKMVLLNLVLLALVAALAWTLRENWRKAEAQQRAFLQQQAQAKKIEPPLPVPLTRPVVAAQYFEVADKSLFSKDRNSIIKEEPPPPPPPPPPVPELPNYHGQMNFGEPVILLSTAKLAQRSYHTGDTVGDFKVVRFDQEKIAFDFKGKTVESRLSELRPKETAAQPGQQGAVAPPPASAANAPSAFVPSKPRIASLSGKVDPDDKNTSDDAMLGADLGGGDRACVEGESSASGTLHSGYRKVSMISLLGPLCHWEKVK